MQTPSSPRSEADLRDFLAAHLDLLELGLTLIGTEFRLPNDLGAGGFIDILARDSTGRLLVIELKRQDQSARQALHELEKYVALLAINRGIRRDQLRCALISTTWRELLVPFARFRAHADFQADALLMILGEDGWPTATEAVELPSLSDGLEMCPLHCAWLYRRREDRDAGSERAIQRLDVLGVRDFVSFDWDASGDDDRVITPHGFYLVFAEFDPELREQIAAELREFESDEDLSEDGDPDDEPERWAEEELVQVEISEVAHAGEVAISEPERLAGYLNRGDWLATNIRGHGRLDDESLYPPDQLMARAMAEGELHSMPFQASVFSSNRQAWDRTQRDLVSSLHGSGDWPQIVDKLLDDLKERPGLELRVHAFAPADIIYGLDAVARGRTDYLPDLFIGWRAGDDFGAIVGMLQWDGSTRVSALDETVYTLFPDFFGYLMAHAFHVLADHEAALCALHGLKYQVVEIGSDDRQLIVEQDAGGNLIRTPRDSADPTGADYIDAHRQYLAAIRQAFDRQAFRG